MKPGERLNSNFRQASLLLIEDNPDQSLLLQKLLQATLPEIRLTQVASADQAIALLGEWQGQEWELPKLILLDLYLPDRPAGWQVLRAIKAMAEPINQIPVVMLSSSSINQDICMAYQLGASAYLVKPLDQSDWLQLVQQIRTYWWETARLPPLMYGF
ncbi:response regulator [Spirosoma pollinicola]|uniref:Response regulator n=1 Tax=Spirosoma pollinicola TaxID=2057025 RepID=A0A2K8Z477_9BACT|nr:response regulator [Spirosoma pollinicola]AUD04670.1 response regulator [Spirosoma pollinicola]